MKCKDCGYEFPEVEFDKKNRCNVCKTEYARTRDSGFPHKGRDIVSEKLWSAKDLREYG